MPALLAGSNTFPVKKNIKHFEDKNMAQNISNLNYTAKTSSKPKVDVSIHKNPLTNNESSYAKVVRDTSLPADLIATVKEKENVPLDAASLLYTATLFKEACVKLLKQGRAVNLFDMGILYLTANGSIKTETPTASDVPDLSLGFTPSSFAKDAVKDIDVRVSGISNNSPVLAEFFDYDKSEYTTEFSASGIVDIQGSFLKLGGEDSGVWLAQATGDTGGYDSSSMIPVAKVVRNRPKCLTVKLPDTLQEGKKYYIVVRTSIGKNGSKQTKTIREGVSDVAVSIASSGGSSD